MKFKTRNTLFWLGLYAVAMALVEAAVVVHLRSLYYPGRPLSLFPMAMLSHGDWIIELGRELATVVMIFTLAMLSQRGFIRVFAAFVYVFGMWDIFYYVWLKLMIGWPAGWLDWDILFLIPWPWIGPWFTPVLIALIFVVWGGRVLNSPREHHLLLIPSLAFVLGVGLALAAFLAPAYPLLTAGEPSLAGFYPDGFHWFLYAPGLLLMGYGLWGIVRKGDIQL